MHQIALTMLLFSCAAILPAQELAKLQLIGKPEKSVSEIVAVRDANGRFCAAVQVISDMDGYSYDSYNGVVKVDDQPGQDMVFLPPDERVLEIFKSGYEPLKIILSEIGIQLRPKEVWKIKLRGDARNADVLPVSILVKPDGAQLFIDGKDLGPGPTFRLSLGQHQLRIARDGYQTLEKAIDINDNNVLFSFTLKEKEDVGVQIESTPGGAKVFLDGLQFGETPVSGFYPQGSYSLRIEKTGYVPVEETIRVAPPIARKSYRLEENVGYLTVNTAANATVYLNDKVISDWQNIKLTPMVARLKVSLPKAETLEKQVHIKRNDRVTIDLYPHVPTVTILVAVTPFDAKIELRGDAGEYFASTGMKVFKDIPIGSYKLSVSKSGYSVHDETIELTTGEKVSRSVKLAKVTLAMDIEKQTPYELPYAAKIDRLIDESVKTAKAIEGMVFVVGGTFQMGSTSGDSDGMPVHSVTISSFYMSEYEVAQKDWRQVMGNNPSRFKGGTLPVENVNWYAAVAFCNKKSRKEGLAPCYAINGKTVTCDFGANGYRLPTEAEWEYAARGGVKSRDYKHSGSNKIKNVAWYDDNSSRKTHPVGQMRANELGLYDMSGNVWEWCWDWIDGEYYENGQQNNPKGPKSGIERVLRGGSWLNFSDDTRVINRNSYLPSYSNFNYGFRIVRTFTATKKALWKALRRTAKK